jgi:hypothetical protein
MLKARAERNETMARSKSKVVQILFNNESLNFVNIEQQEAGMVPFG